MCEHAYFGAKKGVVRGETIQGNVHEHAQNVLLDVLAVAVAGERCEVQMHENLKTWA